MTRHLAAMELDQLMEWKGNKAPKEMFALLAAQRAEKDIQPVGLPAIRKVLRGETHLRGRNETKGRKRRFTTRCIEALDNARERLQEHAAGNKEVPFLQVFLPTTGVLHWRRGAGQRSCHTCAAPQRMSRIFAVPIRYPYGTRTVPVRYPV